MSHDDKIVKLKVIEEKAKLIIEEKFKQMLFECNESDEIIEKEVDESESYINKWRILEQKLSKLKDFEKGNAIIN